MPTALIWSADRPRWQRLTWIGVVWTALVLECVIAGYFVIMTGTG